MFVLSDIVREHATNTPEKNAIINGDRKLSYRVLWEQAENVSKVLCGLGLQTGDRIIASAPSKAEYIILYMAVLHLRAVFVPVLKTASKQEVEYLRATTEAQIIVSDSPKLKGLEGLISYRELFAQAGKGEVISADVDDSERDVNEEELSEILFTSGTTGKPKGGMLSYRAVCASIKNTAEGIGMCSEDVLLIPLPLNHSFGMRVLRSALYIGETIVLQNGFSFAGELTENIKQHNCNCMVCVTAGFEMIKQQLGTGYAELFKNMRYIEFSAGAVPLPLREELLQNLPQTQIYNTWGSTETGGALFLDMRGRQDKLWSAGAPVNDIRIRIVDGEGNELPKDGVTVGRLSLSGEMLISGYYKNEELTSQTICDGWLVTNDAVSIDAEDYVRMRGRVDDMISIGGEKVAPADIESLLMETGLVQECAVIGVDDPGRVLGQVPAAFLVGGAGKEKDLKEYILKKANNFLVPYAFLYVQSLPQNYMGKLDRKELRRLWQEHCDREKVSTTGSDEQGYEDKMNSVQQVDLAAQTLELICTRRTVRNFNDREVEPEKLNDILTAARFAPSGHNMQTWRFTVLQDEEEINELKNVIEVTAKEKQTLVYGFLKPKILIISSNDRRNFDGILDTSAAIENMLLMAHAHGLGAVWLNCCLMLSDEERVRTKLRQYGIPDTHKVYGMVGIGYYDKEPAMPAKKENVSFIYKRQ